MHGNGGMVLEKRAPLSWFGESGKVEGQGWLVGGGSKLLYVKWLSRGSWE
jgi:hypothetical protein